MDQNLGITNNLNPLASPKHVLNVLKQEAGEEGKN